MNTRSCSIVYAKRKKEAGVGNYEFQTGKYRWVKYSDIPIEYLEHQMYSGLYKKKSIKRNKEIIKYIVNRLEKEKKENNNNLGYISFN